MELLENKVYCRMCGSKRNHFVLYKHKEMLELGANKLKYYIDHTILKCAGCDTVTYADIFTSEHIVDTDELGNRVPYKQIVIYPEEPNVSMRIIVKSEIKYSQYIPENIIDIYFQLVTSYNKEHNLLCALGLRTLIEAICNELKISKGFKHDNNGNPFKQYGKKESIEGKIYGLFENNHILWYETLILQRIREIGNAAAHELITPSSDELYSAIDIIERLLGNIYHLKSHKLLKNNVIN